MKPLGFSYLGAARSVITPILTLDFHQPTSMVPAFGYLLILNGVDENQKLYDPARRASEGQDVSPLIYDGPSAPIVPMISGPGSGGIFGNRYVWAYRFKDSRTGNVTALSPLPTERFDMGVETVPGGAYSLGQVAYFNLTGISTSTQFDRIQLFRNTSSGSDALLYLVEERANPGAAAATLFVDNHADEDIITNETAGLLPNADVTSGGPPWPVAKAYVTPGGRVRYYGLVRHPLVRITTDVTNGENTVTASSFRANMAGRRFLPRTDSGGTPLTPTKSYHIVGRTGNVIYPDWAEATASGIYVDIVDDRDGRAVFQSEPALPTQMDPLKTFYVGRDPTDDLMHLFGRNGTTYAVTRRRIIGIDNDNTPDPTVTQIQTVLFDEGQVGLWAGVETPGGYVYLHETLGVRMFTGFEPPYALGGRGDEQFLPQTQLSGIEPALLSESRMFYDPVRHHVILSYVPTASSALGECLVYDMQMGTWRGPWRVGITGIYTLVDDDGTRRMVYGEATGNLMTFEDLTSDVLSRYGSQTISGTVDTIDGAFSFRMTGSSFDPNADRRLVGCPILFDDGAGNVYWNQIAGYDASLSSVLLRDLPSPVLQTGWTFKIAAIRWQAKTTHFDGGEPINPKVLDKVRIRTTTGASGASTGGVADAVDGSSTFSTETGTDTSIAPDTSCYAQGRLWRTGRMHQLRFRGTSTTGDPQITEAAVDLEMDVGS